jgi:hypothetical protein
MKDIIGQPSMAVLNLGPFVIHQRTTHLHKGQACRKAL